MIEASEKVVKASFQGCPLEDREEFSQSQALVSISVGQPYHEAGKFEATLKLIDRSFKSCIIFVCDSLQRHNILISGHYTYEEATQLSIQRGNEWLERNNRYIESLTIPHEIIRWDRWLHHPNYPALKDYIDKQYCDDQKFKMAIDASITEFITRRKKSAHDAFDYGRFFSCSVEYLKEECACIMLWANCGCEFEVYPNGRNEAMALIYESYVKPNFPGKIRPVALRFKKVRRV